MSKIVEVTGSHNIVVQIVGDGNSVELERQPKLVLTRPFANPRQAEIRKDEEGNEVEADLLRPYKERPIPLIGRDQVVAALWAWLEADDPVSVHGIIGGGGRGKTRLAIELCKQVEAQGWHAGFLTSDRMEKFRQQSDVSLWGWSAPTLIVVDYAAAQAKALRKWLIELADNNLLADPQTGKERPLRILLIERHYNTETGWWREMFEGGDTEAETVRSFLYNPKPIDLPPISDLSDRRAILNAMFDRVGSRERTPDADQNLEFDQSLQTLTWGGEPLFLMMAALLGAREGLATVLALSRDDLAKAIAAREISRIEKVTRSAGIADDFARHMAAYTTLRQGLTMEAAFRAIEEEKVATGRENAGDKATIYDALHDALPTEDGLGAITPDMIGEAVILKAWGGGEGCEGDKHIARITENHLLDVIPFLVRLCQDFGSGGHEEPLRWLQTAADHADEDLLALMEVCDAIPATTASMAELAAKTSNRLVDRIEHSSDDVKLNIRALSNSAYRLDQTGRTREALEANDKAVRLCRKFTTQDPDTFIPMLANLLNNQSKYHDALGQSQEALDAI